MAALASTLEKAARLLPNNAVMENQRQGRGEDDGTPIETFGLSVTSYKMRCRIFLPSFAPLMYHEPRIMLRAESTAVSRNSCIGIEDFREIENRRWWRNI